MSKESRIKKRLKQNEKQSPPSQPLVKRNLTAEERAAIVRDRLAHKPIIVLRYPNGKLNIKFIFIFALFIIAMIVALYFSTRY